MLKIALLDDHAKVARTGRAMGPSGRVIVGQRIRFCQFAAPGGWWDRRFGDHRFMPFNAPLTASKAASEAGRGPSGVRVDSPCSTGPA
jgi:hypothetical protein